MLLYLFLVLQGHTPTRTRTLTLLALTLTLTLTLTNVLFQESGEVRRAKRAGALGAYLCDPWNIADWVTCLLCGCIVIMRAYVFVHTAHVIARIKTMAPDEYIDIVPLLWELQQVQNLNASAAFILFIKVFKYLAIVPQMNLIFATLRVAGFELTIFSIVFAVVILGFAMAFYMAFGLDVEGYRSVSASLMSLFQLVLGIFDYDELAASNRLLAPLLFTLFTVLVSTRRWPRTADSRRIPSPITQRPTDRGPPTRSPHPHQP